MVVKSNAPPLQTPPTIPKLTNLVEIEREFSRYGTVESGFEVSGPILRQDVLAAGVLLADPRHPRIHALAAIDVFHGRFPEEEEDVFAYIEGADEIRF